MNYVVESYENYKEEDRLTTNNARKIEFITTTRVLDEVIDAESKILDCAAGTGVYAFWLADKGHDVTATDITPRHIDIINQTIATKQYSMNTAVLNATDMSCFEDDTFDIVLNMGPFYHLLVEQMKVKQGVTEQLKADNQMLWVGKMNNIIACAEEIVVRELVYA